jgi:hypothetical protein
MWRLRGFLWVLTILLFSWSALADDFPVSGRVVDGQGRPVAGASVVLVQGQTAHQAVTDTQGLFQLKLNSAGKYDLSVRAARFQPLSKSVELLAAGSSLDLQLIPLITRSDSVTVTADINSLDVLSPDPAEKVYVRQDLLDANPGRPGAPVSIPGYPIETASSGIKAPQYFAPGVAGDHGEPIAQFIAVGTYLVPNNLSANAHGNGYSDPNIFIPEILESVQVDGGAYNVRQGNHSVNLAAVYGLRSSLDPFITLTGDYRDIDVVTGFSPARDSFVAVEASYGNGFLQRLEHRQQYKFNGQRIFRLGNHQLTLLGMGYYGFSYIPGLVPIVPVNANDADYPNVGDTVDPRQKDQTHTALVALNDIWQLSGRQQLQISGFFRTYNLSLFSDFGQGLIRQSEFRTVTGQGTNYVNKIAESLSLLLGLDYEREAPRRDNLDHYNFYTPGDFTYGPFTKVDSNNVTINSVAPYAAGSGAITHYFRYYAGWRRDQINIDNEDLINSGNSFQKWVGVNSPKATVSFLPKEAWWIPLVSASFGQAFFTEDPLENILAGVGQHQFSQFDSAQGQHAIRDLLQLLAFALHDDHFQAVVMIEMDVRGGKHHGAGRVLRSVSFSERLGTWWSYTSVKVPTTGLLESTVSDKSASRIRSRNASERFLYPRLAIKRSNSCKRSSSSETPVLANSDMCASPS